VVRGLKEPGLGGVEVLVEFGEEEFEVFEVLGQFSGGLVVIEAVELNPFQRAVPKN